MRHIFIIEYRLTRICYIFDFFFFFILPRRGRARYKRRALRHFRKDIPRRIFFSFNLCNFDIIRVRTVILYPRLLIYLTEIIPKIQNRIIIEVFFLSEMPRGKFKITKLYSIKEVCIVRYFRYASK